MIARQLMWIFGEYGLGVGHTKSNDYCSCEKKTRYRTWLSILRGMNSSPLIFGHVLFLHLHWLRQPTPKQDKWWHLIGGGSKDGIALGSMSKKVFFFWGGVPKHPFHGPHFRTREWTQPLKTNSSQIPRSALAGKCTHYPNWCVLLFEVTQWYNCLTRT